MSWETLTTRQLQVLGLFSEGLNTREVADRLSIAPQVVNEHLSRARRHIKATTVRQLMFRLGRNV